MKKKFAILLALFLIAVVCSAGCIDPEDPVDPIDPVDPVDPVDPITPVDPVDPVVPTEEYSVMFMLNYGDAGAYTAETVKAGETVSKPASPTRSGYTFNGWFTAAEGGAAYDFTQPVNADVTLYAQWKKKSSSSSGGSSAPSTPTTPDTSCSHNWGVGDGWVEVNPATCTAPGLKERVCTLCSESETQEIPKLNHNMGAEVVLVPATCVEAGTNVSVCDYGCGETKTIPVVALGHKDSDTDSDTLCDLCGSDLAEPDEGDLHEHIYVLQSVEGNVGTLECNCGDTKTETYVAQVAGKYYTNLAWAIDNASVENVLVLLEDANSEIPKKVAINLNGKNATFTYDNINNVTILSPKGEGTLEVTANGKTVVFGEKVVADNLLPVAVAYTKTGATYSEVDVYSAEGLVWAGETDLRTNEADKGTINIMTNLDMTGLAYYPINNMFITIDGNGNTISNLDCLNDDYSGKSGFLGYGGACTIKDLTLHNVKATGTQVGAFAGGAEALKLENCKLSGHVELTWEQNPADASYQEEYSGIGTVAGISVGITLSSVDISTAEIIIDMRGMDTLAVKASSFPIVGYLPETKYSSPDITGVNQNGAKITILYDGLTQTEDEEGNDLFTVSSGDGLATLMDMVGLAGVGDQGVVFEKAAKIDMSKHDWTPIKVDGYHGADIMTFEGNGATITGLTAPLFAGGFAGGSGIVIKDLTIADSEITSANSQGIGAFVECADSMDEITLINCHLLNSKIIINGESRVGGLVGWTAGYNKQNDGPVDSYITLEDCSVIGCELKAEGSVGGLIGHAGANAATFTTITNCIVKDNTLTSTDSGWRVGVVVGTANNGQVKIEKITSENNVLTQGDESAPEGQSNLYGRFVPAGTGTLVIDGVGIIIGGITYTMNEDGTKTYTTSETTELSDLAAMTKEVEAGDTIILNADVSGDAATTAPYGNKYGVKLDGGILDGNGNELSIECYGDDYGIMTSGGTIKNLKIEDGCRAVMIMYPTENVILDNVNIGGDGVLYPINTGEEGSNPVKLIVTNSVLAGWTSYGDGVISSASFTNVTFKQGTYYNNIYGRVLKPYANTILTDCKFMEHMNLDLSALVTGNTVTIKNCTVNGQEVNAGVFTIPSSDAEYDTALFTVDLPSWAVTINDCIIFE